MTFTERQKQAKLKKLLALSKREKDLIKQELLSDIKVISGRFLTHAAGCDDAIAELWLQTLMEQLARLVQVKSNFKMKDEECINQACIDVVDLLIRKMLECEDELIVDACCSKLHTIVCSQSIVKKAFQDAYEPFNRKEFLFNTWRIQGRSATRLND